MRCICITTPNGATRTPITIQRQRSIYEQVSNFGPPLDDRRNLVRWMVSRDKFPTPIPTSRTRMRSPTCSMPSAAPPSRTPRARCRCTARRRPVRPVPPRSPRCSRPPPPRPRRATGAGGCRCSILAPRRCCAQVARGRTFAGRFIHSADEGGAWDARGRAAGAHRARADYHRHHQRG